MLKRRQVIGTVFSAAALSILPVSAQNVRKGIIVVYSRTGNTFGLAQRIHEKTGYPIIRLELVKPYAENYNDMTYLARDEIRSDARREIATKIPDLSGYTDIYVGGPYWWGGRCSNENFSQRSSVRWQTNSSFHHFRQFKSERRHRRYQKALPKGNNRAAFLQLEF